jgi:hypothetical protein
MEITINNQNEQNYLRKEYFNTMIDLRKIFVGYGRWLEQRNICGQGSLESYEQYLNEGKIIENENLIDEFVSELQNGKYKVILYNKQTPILKDDLGLINLIISDLNEDSEVELNKNTLIIHNEEEIIELTGEKIMSDEEIFARQYLDRCEGTLIIKDEEMQLDMREDNFHDIEYEGYYNKCKDIVDVTCFIGDETDPVWRMNWDAIWVIYKDNHEELWQRM